MMPVKTKTERWKRSQAEEYVFWKNDDVERVYSESRLPRVFGVPYNFFDGKRILEIGCGPSGAIYHLKRTELNIGVEPLPLYDLMESWKRGLVIRGIGERLPFKSDSFDILLCCNALDHTINAETVMFEARRVLKPGGHFLVWVHVLREACLMLKPAVAKFDSIHPYHFTRKELIRLSSKYFDHIVEARGRKPRNWLHRPGGLQEKIRPLVGEIMTSRCYLNLTK